MNNWKIIKGTYLKKDNKIDEMTDNTAKLGDILYYCYRRHWFFFWKLKRILNQQNYDRLCENVKFDGHSVRELYNHVNF